MRLTGIRILNRAIAMRITGCMEKCVESTAGKKAVIRHTQCTLRGGTMEEWTGRW